MHTDTQHIHNFWVAGINYKKSDATIRGQYSINNDQYTYLLSIAPDYGISELFILSTCNRTEIYGLAHTSAQLIDLLCTVTQGDAGNFTQKAYIKHGREAISHLFQVSAGLDSQILGDYEILSQIKNAVKFAKSKGFIHAFSERLVNSVIQSSKAVKTHTSLSGGTVSVSFAAIQYLKQNRNFNPAGKIVLIGCGKIGKSTCKNLVTYAGVTDITLINRTEATAREIAEEMNLSCAPYNQLEAQVAAAEVILVSTSAQEPVITSGYLAGFGNKIVIDLSVPCNVAPDVAELDGVTVVNVDVLSKIKDETLEQRQSEVPHALAIIKEHIDEFVSWHAMRKYAPMLKDMKNKLHGIYVEAGLPICPAGRDLLAREQSIQAVVNSFATNIRKNNNPGCLYIAALNDLIAHHE